MTTAQTHTAKAQTQVWSAPVCPRARMFGFITKRGYLPGSQLDNSLPGP